MVAVQATEQAYPTTPERVESRGRPPRLVGVCLYGGAVAPRSAPAVARQPPAADTTRPADAAWRTETFRRLDRRLDGLLGGKTAASLEPLRVRTVGELMHLLPRRYFSGTELSDLS